MVAASSTRNIADRVILVIAIVVGVSLRLWLATRGHNYDMDSWRDIAEIAAAGQNPYATTSRYNYGPVWFLVLGGLRWVHDVLPVRGLGEESFHVLVAGFLSLADVGIALLLFRGWGLVPGLFFILNPVSILLTGYHSQFDNLAVLPALAAWMVLTRGDGGRWKRIVASALLLGLSLTIKHFMVFFPLWVLMAPGLVPKLSRRIAFALISLGLFIVSFLPFLFTPEAAEGIWRNVINYASLSSQALMPAVMDLFVPLRAVDSLFGLLPPDVSVVRHLFHAFMIFAGWCFARRVPGELFVCYLASVLVFTSVVNDQYLAIPLVACAIWWRTPWGWMYTILSAAIVHTSAISAGVFPGPPWWRTFLPGLLHRHAIVWLAVLLVGIVMSAERGKKKATGETGR